MKSNSKNHYNIEDLIRNQEIRKQINESYNIIDELAGIPYYPWKEELEHTEETGIMSFAQWRVTPKGRVIIDMKKHSDAGVYEPVN